MFFFNILHITIQVCVVIKKNYAKATCTDAITYIIESDEYYAMIKYAAYYA